MGQLLEIGLLAIAAGGVFLLWRSGAFDNLVQQAQGAIPEGYTKNSVIWNLNKAGDSIAKSALDWGPQGKFPGTVPPGVDPIKELNLVPETRKPNFGNLNLIMLLSASFLDH